MVLEDIKEAIENKSIDHLLAYVRRVEPEDLDEAIELYEKYYESELNLALTVQGILAQIRTRRNKQKIPTEGSYTLKLNE